MTQNVLLNIDGRKFWASARQAETLETLKETRKGGVATIKGYRPSTGYVTSPVVDLQVITRFSTAATYERYIMAVEAVTFEMVAAKFDKYPKLKALSVTEGFDAYLARKAYLIDAKRKSLAGERDTAAHAAHDRNYIHVTDGVRIHLETEKVDDVMVPVIRDGFPVLSSIMLSVLELNRTVITEGVSKPEPNSGVPVLIGNLIESFINKRSTGFKTVSLKVDNFDSVKIDRKVITESDISSEPLHRVV